MTQTARAAIQAVEYYLPEARLTNEELAAEHPTWNVEKLGEKIGIEERHVSRPDEFSSDLAASAAKRLFATGAAAPEDIDYLILCTQSPDYFYPTTACLVQDLVGLPTSCGALDINLGCSGYVYGLGLAKGLIETGQARRVLFVTGDTHTKIVHPRDRSVRPLFGDAGTATLITDQGTRGVLSGPFTYGTDGRGSIHLIVPAGGMRHERDPNAPTQIDESGNERTINNVYMNGAEIFAFTVREVPPIINKTLAAASLTMDDIDLFVLHQASAQVLGHLQRKLKVAPERFAIDMADCGNTGSSTIPIALSRAIARGEVRPGMRVMLVGFGVGFSWGAALVNWS